MIGQTLGHYRVGEQLGRGGMGEVYVADDLNLNRKVALKFLPEAFAADPERMARFEREAKVLASLNHPNIAAIHGLEEAEGKRFLVLELVEGETLAQRLSTGRLPVDEALGICRQIAEGLEAAHEKGVIHRDLKPANVMITEGDKVKILDFGLAKALSDEAQSVDSSQSPTLTEAMTRPGVVLGTAAYMSPEQAKGKAVDKRADIWAFGCILYECLTGKRAFEGETVTETLAAILKGEPAWQALPAATPPGILFVLRRCLEKNIGGRFHCAADMRMLMEEAGVLGEAGESQRSKGRRVWRLAAALAGTALLAAAVGSITTWYLKPSPNPQAPSHVSIALPPGDLLEPANFLPLALSPDGRHLVYSAIRGGIRQLFLRTLDSRDTIVVPGSDGAENPFFSPDGRWIGFFAEGKLRKVSIAGGAPQTLCASIYTGGASWGTDGRIVFTPSAGSGLWQVSAEGGVPQELTKLDYSQNEVSHRYPQHLPGGKALLFTVWAGEGWDETHVAVLRLDTGERRIVRRGGHTGCFAPTGHLVYYRAGSLLAIPFDPVRLEVPAGSSPVAIVEGVAQCKATTGAEYAFSWNGSLAYVPAGAHQLQRRLVWVDRKGEAQPLPAPVRPYANAALSWDGKQVAVTIAGGMYENWVYDLSRGTLTRLTSEGVSNMYPVWSPDGKRIVYRATRQGFRNLFWRAVDGTGAEERLTTGEGIHNPYSWSADGNWLAYTRQIPVTNIDIWVLPMKGDRKSRPFLSSPFAKSMPAFSPDGRYLAYMSLESGQEEIYVQPFPGPGSKWQISTDGGDSPRWAPNGREIFYRNGNRMMAAKTETQPAFSFHAPRLLFEGNYLAASAASYDVSPDGRFLMIQTVEPEQPATQIHFVSNWFDELKRKVPSGKR